jgi:hypothetical protein
VSLAEIPLLERARSIGRRIVELSGDLAERLEDFFLEPPAAGAASGWTGLAGRVRWRRAGPALGALAVLLAGLFFLLFWHYGPRAKPPPMPNRALAEKVEARRAQFDPHGGDRRPGPGQ